MPIVVFSRSFFPMTRGDERVEIDAVRVRDLIDALYSRYPDLEGHLEDMAVAIDDEIHNDARYLRLESDSEIHFVPRIGGG